MKIHEMHTVPHVKMKKNSDIEALRATAIILVIFAHVAAILSPTSIYWALLEDFRFGYGVDIFFCVSGFIITKSIKNEIPNARSLSSLLGFSVPFWIRRFWRLMPSALFWIGICLALSYFLSEKGVFLSLDKILPSAIAAAFQYFNFIYSSARDAGTLGDTGIYWSLSLENQFYFILPIVAAMLGKRWMPLFFAALILSQFFLTRQLIRPTPELWALRTDAISFGVLLALWHGSQSYKNLEPTFFKNSLLFSVTVSAIIVLLASLTAPSPPLPFAMGLTALISALLVWIASYNGSYFTKNNLIATVSNYIGSRSYAIYLTHVICLSLVRHLFFSDLGDPTPTNFDVAHTSIYIASFLAMTLVLSELSYRFLEMPLRSKGEGISNKVKYKLSPT
ncbi:peptidoglycan/LPS O-acetylase OafA/YrhL [Pseudomonas sp. Tn43]|uniref:acyltransferase family protein n=1 Tax=Pseudomonas sp. Tn43 TaxID=701213 RepID=UPI001805461B|nr:acyltransferase [Pseudomonas sp. Tn43]MBB3239130.1 peptidoglycan/LPS O-acetylase OafA/YrhL [Pseudomonas sp. Tn43]